DLVFESPEGVEMVLPLTHQSPQLLHLAAIRCEKRDIAGRPVRAQLAEQSNRSSTLGVVLELPADTAAFLANRVDRCMIEVDPDELAVFEEGRLAELMGRPFHERVELGSGSWIDDGLTAIEHIRDHRSEGRVHAPLSSK